MQLKNRKEQLIIKKKLFSSICIILALSMLFIANVSAQTTDRAYSTETAYVFYTGIAEFTASYTVPTNPGYYLTVGKHVKQAYVNYTRAGVCVTTTGQRAYTFTASSASDNCHYSVEAHAWDSLNPWAPTTKFFYGWFYF